MNNTIENLKTNLLKELNNNKEDILKNKYPEDYINEIVDSNVPVYNSDLLEMAINDLTLAVDSPDILAFDGRPSAVNAIAGNIYELLYEEAMRWLKQQK